MKKTKIAGAVFLVLTVVFLSTYKSWYITRVLIWNNVSIEDYKIFPERQIRAPEATFYFTKDTTRLDLENLNNNFREKFGFQIVTSLDHLLKRTKSTALLILRNDTLVYEKYFNGYTRNSINTSFSISKSITSALIGIAVEEGHIENINDPISKYIEEVKGKGDQITIKHLITMTSGIDYNPENRIFGDETRAYYEPDLRKYALEFKVGEEPGNTFEYNNINPLLLGIILERTTGISVSKYLEEKIWKPVGAEFPASWSLDHVGFEKMESGINARAVDFLKFGRLYLRNGMWNSKELVPSEYVGESTSQSENPVLNNVQESGYGYKYYWWLYPRPDGRNDYWAEGNLGQFIYVSPATNIVIVRHGKEYAYSDWPDFFYKLTEKLSN